MKVVVFSDTYLPKIDGVGISTDQFCRLLAARGHEFVICAPQYGPKEDTVGEGPGISVIRFTNRPLPSYPEVKLANLSLRRIREAMSIQPDLVHIQTPGPMGQYGIAAARLYTVPVVGTYHTMVNEVGMYISPYRLLKLDKLVERVKGTFSRELRTELKRAEHSPKRSLSNRLILRITNELYNRCEVVVSPTELIARELTNGGVKRPIEIVSNGLELDRFRGSVRSLPERVVRYLHVGRLSFEKNVDVLLWAFIRILQVQPARFNPGIIQYFIDDGQQCIPGLSNHFHVLLLHIVQSRIQQQSRHSHDGIQRRSDFMADICQKTAFCLHGDLGGFHGQLILLLPEFMFGNIHDDSHQSTEGAVALVIGSLVKEDRPALAIA